jgi:nucleoporin NUP2
LNAAQSNKSNLNINDGDNRGQKRPANGNEPLGRVLTPKKVKVEPEVTEASPNTEHEAQINLTAQWPGTENENVLYEIKAKAKKFIAGGETSHNSWKVMGTGSLRVSKHSETGLGRIVVRTVPAGVVVLNNTLISGTKYVVKKKTVTLLARADDGHHLETWLVSVETSDDAKELASVLKSCS